MDDLIHVINKLQDVFATVGARQDIKLPQIVVVGSQVTNNILINRFYIPHIIRTSQILNSLHLSHDFNSVSVLLFNDRAQVKALS